MPAYIYMLYSKLIVKIVIQIRHVTERGRRRDFIALFNTIDRRVVSRSVSNIGTSVLPQSLFGINKFLYLEAFNSN